MAAYGTLGAPDKECSDPNRRVDPCGCVWRFCAPPLNAYVRFDRCAEHRQSA